MSRNTHPSLTNQETFPTTSDIGQSWQSTVLAFTSDHSVVVFTRGNFHGVCLSIVAFFVFILTAAHKSLRKVFPERRIGYLKKLQVPPRFELGSLDSESRVLTITPWNLLSTNCGGTVVELIFPGLFIAYGIWNSETTLFSAALLQLKFLCSGLFDFVWSQIHSTLKCKVCQSLDHLSLFISFNWSQCDWMVWNKFRTLLSALILVTHSHYVMWSNRRTEIEAVVKHAHKQRLC